MIFSFFSFLIQFKINKIKLTDFFTKNQYIFYNFDDFEFAFQNMLKMWKIKKFNVDGRIPSILIFDDGTSFTEMLVEKLNKNSIYGHVQVALPNKGYYFFFFILFHL